MSNIYSGGVINSGANNTVLGIGAGEAGAGVTYDNSVFIGNSAAKSSPSGDGGVVLGSSAASDRRTAELVAVGYQCAAGVKNYNEFGVRLGVRALANENTSNQGDLAIGYESMYLRTGSGSNTNTALGYQSLRANSTGGAATIAGALSDQTSSTIPNNICVLGAQCDAGAGLRNILLGRGGISVGTQRLHIGSAAVPVTTSTSASAGTNGALPGPVVGYLLVVINGVLTRIPYFNV